MNVASNTPTGPANEPSSSPFIIPSGPDSTADVNRPGSMAHNHQHAPRKQTACKPRKTGGKATRMVASVNDYQASFQIPRCEWDHFQITCQQKSDTPTSIIRQFILNPGLPPLRNVYIHHPSARDAQIHRDIMGILTLASPFPFYTKEPLSIHDPMFGDDGEDPWCDYGQREIKIYLDRILATNALESPHQNAMSVPISLRQCSRRHIGTVDLMKPSIDVPTCAWRRFRASCTERGTNASSVIRSFIRGELFDFVRHVLVTAEPHFDQESSTQLNAGIAKALHVLQTLALDPATAHTNRPVQRQLGEALSDIHAILQHLDPTGFPTYQI